MGAGLFGAGLFTPLVGSASLAGAAFTGAVTISTDVAAVQTPRLTVTNTTAAAAGAQQWSTIRTSASGWKTDATAGPITVLFDACLETIQGTAAPTSILRMGTKVGAAAQIDNLLLFSSGGVGLGGAADPGAGNLGILAAKGIYTGAVPHLVFSAANVLNLGSTASSAMTRLVNPTSCAFGTGNDATGTYMNSAATLTIWGTGEATGTTGAHTHRGANRTGSNVAPSVHQIRSGLGTGDTAANMGYLSVAGGISAGATTTAQTAQEVARFYGNGISIASAAGCTTPNASALIDMISTTQGLGAPSMTTTQRDAIGTPRAGIVIYNNSTNKLNFRAASAWEAVTSA